jgi:hypothetical protein
MAEEFNRNAELQKYKWLTYEETAKWEPLAEDLEVSEVARSKEGFMQQWDDAGGDPRNLDDYWINRRNDFVARHMAQYRNNDEPLWDEDGIPTRRHLALIMWAYSPSTSLDKQDI